MIENKNITHIIWVVVKAIIAIIFTAVISYKIYVTPIDLKIDFPILLSLLLALFSVGLSALFYFKATDTSNVFYNNTYNFTKDIAQLLTKIESGFGERLRHLDEGYTSMRDYIQHFPNNGEKYENRKKIDEEKEEIKKVLEERNKIIEQILEKSQLHENEKNEFLEKLKEKEKDLEEAQSELSRMRRRVFMDKIRSNKKIDISSVPRGLIHYTKEKLIPESTSGMSDISDGTFIRRYNRFKPKLPSAYISDLEEHGFVDQDGDLTESGIQFLRILARGAD